MAPIHGKKTANMLREVEVLTDEYSSFTLDNTLDDVFQMLFGIGGLGIGFGFS